MKPISGIVGLVLILASVVVVVLSTSEESYLDKKNNMVEKYVSNSKQALANDNIKGAIKYAKLAIIVDPKNKKGFKAYEAAIELKYKPSEDEQDDSSDEERPSADDEEEEEAPDMGC
ncbi:MAG TPA: hypothetical protein EYG73_10135 [Arcobacter sp.]|nr:hypothetical protein [Arcobacter sp.]